MAINLYCSLTLIDTKHVPLRSQLVPTQCFLDLRWNHFKFTQAVDSRSLHFVSRVCVWGGGSRRRSDDVAASLPAPLPKSGLANSGKEMFKSTRAKFFTHTTPDHFTSLHSGNFKVDRCISNRKRHGYFESNIRS